MKRNPPREEMTNDQFPIFNDQTLGIGFWGFIERWALGFGVLLSLIVSGSVIVHRGAIAMGAKEEREGTVYMAGLEAAVSDSVVRRSGAGKFVTPDDPDFYKQDYLQRIGAQASWAYATGSAEVVVAVVDSGVDKIGRAHV